MNIGVFRLLMNLIVSCIVLVTFNCKKNFVDNEVRPSMSVNPASGSVVSGLSQIDINFSEPVVGGDIISNYSLSGSGVNLMSIASITLVNSNTYRLNISGASTNGMVTLTISNITDVAKNTLQVIPIEYIINTALALTQVSNPTSGSSLSNLTQIDITYSSGVSGATSSNNYVLSGAGVGSLSVGSVSLLGGNGYRLALSGTPSSGALTVTINGVQDLSAGTLTNNVISYTLDLNAPTQSTSPVSGSSHKILTQIDITYSETVTGALTLGNYVLSGTGLGSLTASSVSLVTGNTYRLLTSGTPSSGSVTLTISSIQDLVANNLAGNSVTYSVDAIAPTLVASPTSGSTVSTLAQINITYSEPVTGATTLGNYVLSGLGKGSLAITSITTLGGNLYRLNLSGTPATGTITVTVSGVQDLITNALSNNIFSYTGNPVVSLTNHVIVVGNKNNGTDSDWWIKKYDSKGIEDTVNWNKIIDSGTGSDYDVRVAIDSSNNVYVAGLITNASAIRNIMIKKFDKNGVEDTVNWNKIISFTAYNARIGDIAIDSNGALYLIGTRQTTTSTASLDWVIKKFSPNGVEDLVGWNKIVNKGNDVGYSIFIDKFDNIYTMGSWNQGTNGNTINNTFHIIKYNTVGTVLRTIDYAQKNNGSWNAVPQVVTVDNAGNIIAAGRFGWDNGNPNFLPWDEFALTLIKGNSLGVESWRKQITQAIFAYNSESFKSIVTDSTGAIYACGFVDRNFSTVSGAQNWDITIRKYSSTGIEDTVNWKKAFGSSLYNEANCYLELDGLGNIYFLSYMNNGTNNDWVIKRYNQSGIEDLTNWNKTIVTTNGGAANQIAIFK